VWKSKSNLHTQVSKEWKRDSSMRFLSSGQCTVQYTLLGPGGNKIQVGQEGKEIAAQDLYHLVDVLFSVLYTLLGEGVNTDPGRSGKGKR